MSIWKSNRLFSLRLGDGCVSNENDIINRGMLTTRLLDKDLAFPFSDHKKRIYSYSDRPTVLSKWSMLCRTYFRNMYFVIRTKMHSFLSINIHSVDICFFTHTGNIFTEWISTFPQHFMLSLLNYLLKIFV